jgi:hypothetical protein
MIERCQCGTVLPLENNVNSRTPCPSCGSTTRVFERTESATTHPINTSLGLKARSAGGGRPWYELFAGGQWSDGLKRIVQKVRIINRRDDAYHERVVDIETGTILKDYSERLREHTDHGSAKPSLRRKGDRRKGDEGRQVD